jgi:hypothetical protein
LKPLCSGYKSRVLYLARFALVSEFCYCVFEVFGVAEIIKNVNLLVFSLGGIW